MYLFESMFRSRISKLGGRERRPLDGVMPLEISGSSVEQVWTQKGQTVASTIFGSTVLVNGRGWAGRTWSTKQGLTELKERLLPAMFQGRDIILLDGPMRQEICGSGVGLVWTRPGTADNSTICGSTVRANGRGWVGRTWPTKQGPTELKGRLLPATFLGRDLQVLVGLTRPEICGSSVEAVTTRPGQPVGSTTCGSTSPNHTHLMRLMMGSSDRFSITPTSRPEMLLGESTILKSTNRLLAINP